MSLCKGKLLAKDRPSRVVFVLSSRYHSFGGCSSPLVQMSTMRGLSTDASVSTSTDEKPEPWKTLLGMPARAAWRVSEPRLPYKWAEAQQFMLDQSYHHNKHLLKFHQDIIQDHRALAERRDRERRRILLDREYKQAEVKRDSGINPVLYGRKETFASIKYRLFPNYAVTLRVLREAKSLLGDSWSPKAVVDFGMGCASASAASTDLWNDIEWIHGIEASGTMREAAQTFLEEGLKEQGTRVTISAHLSAETAPPNFDLALCCYTAIELPHVASTLSAVALLWQKLRPNGVFVMIEPGTPDGFSSIRTVRNMLLDCCPPGTGDSDVDECHIVAPCTHNGRCPMDRFMHLHGHGGSKQDDVLETGDEEEDVDDTLRKGYCSFVQTMPGSSGKGNGEKFSYLVAQKRVGRPTEPALRPFDGAAMVDLLREARFSEEPSTILEKAIALEDRFLDSEEDELGLEFMKKDTDRASFGRIIHAPKKRRGHILIDSCVGPGAIVRQSVAKSMSNKAPGIYAAARKARWGGLWPNLYQSEDDEAEQ